jgi:hypothetical protein
MNHVDLALDDPKIFSDGSCCVLDAFVDQSEDRAPGLDAEPAHQPDVG